VNTVPGREHSLRDLLQLFSRRRRVIVSTLLALFFIALFLCVFMTRRYKATSVFQLQKSSSDGLDLTSLMGAADASGGTDALSVNIDLQTQADILQSSTLALQVIRELNLAQNKDFKPRFNPINWVLAKLSPSGPPDPANASLEESPHRREHLVNIFSNNLQVKVTAGTRLIEVDYSNSDPKVAAAVVNHLVQALIDYTFQTKFNATSQVSNWLEGQLGDLRKQSEELQSKVVALQQNSGIFGVGGTDPQGKPVIYSPILDRLQASTAALSQAELNRIAKAAVYQVVQTGSAELISQLSGTNIGSGASPGVTTSLTLIQSLRTQQATLQAQIAQDSAVYGPAFPKLIQERASLERIGHSLQDEIDRVAVRAKNDFEVASATEIGARRAYESDRQAAERLNDKTIEYAIVEKEADQSQALYQDLLKRLKEAGILEGLRSSNITVVDPARAPSRPHSPNVPLFLSLGLGLGVFLGGCGALLTDAIDSKIQGVEEIEALRVPLLGLVPQVKADELRKSAILVSAPNSAFSEAIRRLRSSLLVSRSGRPPKVVLVTSGSPGEGKSTLTLNLALALAQFDKKVLLVEGDLRRPVLRARLDLPGTGGLSVMLSNESAPTEIITSTMDPRLYLLPAGPPPPYPAELLGSQRMSALIEQWRTEYDFIVIDSPPILSVTDVQLLEPHAEATLLVARAAKTSRIALQRSYKLLLPHVMNPSMPSVGIVLNAISLRSSAYYGYYGYYGSKKNAYYQDGGGNADA